MALQRQPDGLVVGDHHHQVGAVLVGDRRQEQRRRCRIGEAHRVVVDLLDLGRRAVGVPDPAGEARRQLLVEQLSRTMNRLWKGYNLYPRFYFKIAPQIQSMDLS